MIGYFKIRITRPRKPTIHNMLLVSWFHMHKYFGNLRMFFTHTSLHCSRNGMSGLHWNLGIDLQVQIYLIKIPCPTHTKIMIGKRSRSRQNMLTEILNDRSLWRSIK